MNIQKKLLLDSLNLSDNDIEDIKYSDDSIYITLSRQKLTCPCCGSLHLKSKGFYTRNIKTPNQLFACYSIHLRIRRYSCPECGHSFGDDKHLAPPHNSVSYNVIFEVMKLLRDSKMTFKQVSRLTGIPESTVTRIFDKHCHIARYSFPEVLCIDEVYIPDSSFKSKYSCCYMQAEIHQILQSEFTSLCNEDITSFFGFGC